MRFGMKIFDIHVNKLFCPEENTLTRKSSSYFASNTVPLPFNLKYSNIKTSSVVFMKTKKKNGFLLLKKALNTTVKKLQPLYICRK
jgi:hypothetical protein